VFGTEPNKALLIDFLNTLLPDYHHVRDVTFRNAENVGNTVLDRKAIFDIYCEAENGDRFIVEIQKAKQNFFKDRSVYYSTFPIQLQAPQGEWNFQLSAIYTGQSEVSVEELGSKRRLFLRFRSVNFSSK
jgi:predicted transposase/invertase (TIGR01784 family)